MKRLLIVFCFFLFFSNIALSQRALHTKDTHAIKKYKKSLFCYKKQKYDNALRFLKDVLDTDSDFLEAYILGYRISKVRKDTLGQILNLSAVLSRSETFAPNAFFILGDLYFSRYEYTEASRCYKKFLINTEITNRKRKEATSLIIDCLFAKEALKHPSNVEIINISAVNSNNNDYWPFINIYSNEIFFTRLSITKYRKDENIIMYNLKDSVFLDLPFNSAFNEGTSSITADGRHLFFSSNSNKGYGGQDIYVVLRDENGWHEPVNVGDMINTDAWESQTSVSADGKFLYFVSNRKGGKGGSDIYRSEILKWNNKNLPVFSEPENLSINTQKDEMSPCIYPDNKTLFFSSKGLPSIGGFDIYKSVLIDDFFSSPENLGFPLNSNKDELGFSISQNGDVVLFGSERNGDMDVYSCKLPERFKQSAIVNRLGHIVDEDGVVLNAKFFIKEQLMNKGKSDFISIFLACKKNYVLYVIAEGYKMYSEQLNLQDSLNACCIYSDIVMHKNKIGDKSILRNVQFDFDSYILKESSYIQLSLLYEFLNSNKSLVIEIGGHTDNIGDDVYNMLLSENRAKCIYDYLIKLGVSPRSLQIKGYGNLFPISSNAVEEGRSFNRRTEITIISK
jgi:outer membrane protein OmpA-like peptidoglycan-associated protein/Tol biopolymer transport system component